jgi:hypothetical protein
MGMEKKFQMLRGEFETAIQEDDADGVLAVAPQILEELDAYRDTAHKYAVESRHLELTSEERRAIELLCYFTEQPDQKDDAMAKYAAATLRGLLARTTPPAQPRNFGAQIASPPAGDDLSDNLWGDLYTKE